MAELCVNGLRLWSTETCEGATDQQLLEYLQKPKLDVDGMDLARGAEDGLLKVLVYSMELNPIPAGTHVLSNTCIGCTHRFD